MRIKICGITQPEQGMAIAGFGATALGFILVPSSPRCVSPTTIQNIITAICRPLDYIGVFADADLATICNAVRESGLTGVQLHGGESPEFCDQLRETGLEVEIIKALRVQDAETLEKALLYGDRVDTLLLDAYHPQQLGGTGQTLDWTAIAQWRSPLPWFLAGGLTPDNILDALTHLSPHGVDLSSGVERSPGNKNLDKVALLFDRLRSLQDSP